MLGYKSAFSLKKSPVGSNTDRPAPGTRSRGLATALLSILIGLAVAALAAEGLTRLFFDEPMQPRFVMNPGYGVRWNQPHVDTRHYSPGEYDVRVTTNSVGMRGPREYAIDAPPGTRRIVLLGDSFTFGFGVEDPEVVSAVLEDLLNARGDASRWEVINLGVSGFGQAEELVTWENRGRQYHPQMVVVLYFENDIGNNAVAQLYADHPDGTVSRTGSEYLPGVRLQEKLYAIAPIRFLFEHSQAWNLIRNRLSQLVQNSMLKQQGLQTFDDATPTGVGLTRALLGQLAREIEADGAQPVFLVIPNQPSGMKSNFPMTAAEVEALGAILVDGRTFLAPDDYHPRDGHWRPSGHRKAAEQIAKVTPAP